MVRLMAGTLLEVGRGKTRARMGQRNLSIQRKSSHQDQNFQPKDLTLIQIEYPEDRANAE